MWKQNILFALFAITVAGVAMIDANMQFCDRQSKMEELPALWYSEDTTALEFLEIACAKAFGYLDCVDDVAKEETGFTVKQLQTMAPTLNVRRRATLFNNARNVIGDLCTDGSDINEAFKENFKCLASFNYDIGTCIEGAKNAYKIYRDIGNVTGDDSQEDQDLNPHEMCLMETYMLACFTTQVHDHCGRDSFDFLQEIIRRSSFIKLGICSEEGVIELNNDFLESLVHVEEHHSGLYRLVFDLRKRRK